MPRLHHALLLGCALLAGCDSKVTQTEDTDLLAKVETVTDCFPDQMEALDYLLQLVELWRLNDNDNPANPSGLTCVLTGPTLVVDWTIPSTSITIHMGINFYSPTGAQQTLTLSNSSVVSLAVDDAATQLRNLFSTANPFMTGDWTISGGGYSGSGTLTGIIGGSTNGNELEEIFTSANSTTISGGVPANATNSITIAGTDTCSIVFETAGTTGRIATDQTPGQEYPEGVLDVTITNLTADPDVVLDAALTFDGTATALLTVTGIQGVFEINLDTFSVHHSR